MLSQRQSRCYWPAESADNLDPAQLISRVFGLSLAHVKTTLLCCLKLAFNGSFYLFSIFLRDVTTDVVARPQTQPTATLHSD